MLNKTELVSSIASNVKMYGKWTPEFLIDDNDMKSVMYQIISTNGFVSFSIVL